MPPGFLKKRRESETDLDTSTPYVIQGHDEMTPRDGFEEESGSERRPESQSTQYTMDTEDMINDGLESDEEAEDRISFTGDAPDSAHRHPPGPPPGNRHSSNGAGGSSLPGPPPPRMSKRVAPPPPPGGKDTGTVQKEAAEAGGMSPELAEIMKRRSRITEVTQEGSFMGQIAASRRSLNKGNKLAELLAKDAANESQNLER